MKLWQGLALTSVVGAGLALGFYSNPEVRVLADKPSALASTAQPSASVPEAAPAALAELKTFRGAQVDGALLSDHRGHLVVDMALKHWIDFHLSASGELSIAQIKAYMQEQMRKLPEPAQHEALSLLDAYLGYLDALAHYDAKEAKSVTGANLSDVEARVLWQQRLRRQWLEPQVVAAFFTGDEDIDLYTIAAQKLRKEGASQAELDALESTLPEPIIQMREESRTLLNLAKSEEELRKNNASAAEVQAWRVQKYGEAAAERLAHLDQEQNAWRERLRQYQSYENSPALKSLSASEREQKLQSYRAKAFSDTEQKRLSAALVLLDAQ